MFYLQGAVCTTNHRRNLKQANKVQKAESELHPNHVVASAALMAGLERWKSQHAANVIADFEQKGIRLDAKSETRGVDEILRRKC